METQNYLINGGELIKINKIYIVTDAPIPIGMASTNRIISYANGFVANGVDDEVIIFRKTENYNEVSNHKSDGNINGTRFKYLFRSTIKSKYFLKRRIDNFYGAVRLFWFSIFKIKSNSALIYYSSYTYAILVLKLAKFFNKSILLKEESEHPDIYSKTKNYLSKTLFTKIHYQLFDGYLLMTNSLVTYFNTNNLNITNIHIPMTVDLERFSFNKMNCNKTLTYIGCLNDEKDGVNILIKAFSKILKKYPEYTLALYGDAPNSIIFESYIRSANELGIPKSNIYFYGKVNSDLIPQILSESKLLLLARPNSKQAENGFPTKLGEYLASGIPVIVTSIGEIPQYLKDGESAFIAEPSDIDSFASKIEEALNNYKNATRIGLNGKKVAEKHFNNILQTKKIINFIEQF